MSIKLQLICFAISFIYGILIYWLYFVNRKFIFKSNYLGKIVIYILLSYLSVIGYIDLFYFLNKGMFHIYFLGVLGLGVLVGKKLIRRK